MRSLLRLALALCVIPLCNPPKLSAQAVRYDSISATTSAQCPSGAACALMVLPGTQANFCGASGLGTANTAGTVVTATAGPSFTGATGNIQINGTSYPIQTVVSSTVLVLQSPGAGTQTGATTSTLAGCLANPATSYTTSNAGTPCPTTAQLTPASGGSCSNKADAQGNLGGWFLAGQYYYYLQTPATAGNQIKGPYPLNIGASTGCPSNATCDANYATLALGCTAAGSGTLYVTKAWNGLTTAAYACAMTFLATGKVQPASGQTVTLAACPQAGLNKIFDLSAGGLIALSACPSVYPQWWGAKEDGSTDDTTALNQSLAAAIASSVPLTLPPGTFLATTASGGKILDAEIPTGKILALISLGATVHTTTSSADLWKFNASNNGNPILLVSGALTLVGPDALAGPCNTTNGGNGFYLEGNSGAFLFFNTGTITSSGFCGSGKAAVLLSAVEDSRFGMLNAQWSDIGIKLANAANGNSMDASIAAVNKSYGFYDAGSNSNTFNALVVQSNVKTGYYCAGCTENSYNSAHFEANNTSASATDHALYLDSTTGAVRGLVFNSPSFNGTHEDLYMKGNASAATGANVFNGGVSNSGATTFAILDGPKIFNNTFNGLFDFARLSRLNYDGIGQNLICSDASNPGNLCTSVGSNANTTRPGAVTYANLPGILAGYPSPPVGTVFWVTDASNNTWGSACGPGGGANSVQCVFDAGFNWIVIGK